MLPATDSLLMRVGDIIDPVTGLPIRTFKSKPKSKLPLIIGGAMLLAVVGLAYYTSTRPPPPVSLLVTEQLGAGDGSPYELTIDTKSANATSIKIKGVESKAEQGLAKIALPDNAIPVGKSTLEAEALVGGNWRATTPLAVIRPSRIKVSIDKPKEILTFDFEVMAGGTAINLFGKEAKVEGGKAHLEMPFRVATTSMDQGPEINKEAAYQITGIDGDFSFQLKFPAPKPLFLL